MHHRITAVVIALSPLVVAGGALSPAWSANLRLHRTPDLVIAVRSSGERVGPYNVERNPTLAGAIGAFGRPSSCRVVRGAPLFAVARWSRLDLRIEVGSLGGYPAGKDGCSAPGKARVSTIDVFGRQWRTAAGLRVGEDVVALKRAYPHASLHRDGWWLVSKSSPLFGRYGLLVAHTSRGRVTALHLNVHAEGD